MFHVKIEDNSVGKDGGKVRKQTEETRDKRWEGCVRDDNLPEWSQVLEVTKVAKEDERK